MALTAAAVVLTGAAITTGSAAAAPSASPDSLNVGPHSLRHTGKAEPSRSGELPSGVPATGRYSFLLELDTPSTGRAFASKRSTSITAARTAARQQLGRVTTAQDAVIADLPVSSPVLYRTHALLSGVAVTTDVANFADLAGISGVSHVYPIAPKSFENSTAVPLQGAPQAWTGSGSLGQDTRVAIIDTGIDYTHANFGGPGTVAAYQAANAAEASAADSALFPNAKVVGGYDLVGDNYQADPGSAGYQPVPHADPNPLDCNGHGSHVGGTVGGYGEDADGGTYTGSYDESTPFDTMKIGPGMAPSAQLLAIRVFGCTGSTDMVTEGIDRAADPNQDGDTSDAVDVINMSLGSDFGSPRDADSLAANKAVEAGITVAISSGNSYDLYDVGGSPGAASKAITVAASADSTSILDGVDIDLDGSGELYGVSRSIAYSWSTKPDLSGDVVLAPADNATACTAFSPGDAAKIAGKIVLVTWTQEALECGSAARGGFLKAAGAAGFIFANSAQVMSAGITGVATIPGVLVVKSGGDAIRAALAAGKPVTATGTKTNSVTQFFPEDTDKVADFSSRGMRGNGNIKPDVAAVGASVFSTAVGTGDDGVSESGTSMASPMVAGLAALVVSAHPAWSPEQVKADIMNTAGQNLYVDGSSEPSSARYAPNRVGAGRIQAAAALTNEVLAYVADDPGAVSVSFGPVEVTAPMTATKTVTVQNTGDTAATYAASYDAITSVPGVSYAVAPASVSVAPGAKASVTVTFTVTDPTLMTHTTDPTHGREDLDGDALDTLADASGNLLLTPTTGSAPQLRVPVYSAPRPTSTMTQADTTTLPTGASTGSITLSGTGVDNGTGAERVRSIAAGLELQAISPALPDCIGTQVNLCAGLPDDRSADLKYVGYASDYPIHQNVAASTAYIAINTRAAYSTPGSKVEFDAYIDVDGDTNPELMAYTSRIPDEDLFVANLVELSTGDVVDVQPLNGALGLDLAKFDSDTLMIPLSMGVLAKYGVNESNPRIGYGVVSFASTSLGVVDAQSISVQTAELVRPMIADLYTPGISVTDAEGDGPLVLDQDSAQLSVTRNAASYKAGRGLGLMMVHFHNAVGSKAQVVAIKSTPTVAVAADPASVLRGTSTQVTVAVSDPSGFSAPTGTVQVVDTTTGTVAGSATVQGGSATVTYRPTTAGAQTLEARYLGDTAYVTASSSPTTITVSKSASGVALQVRAATVVRGTPARLKVIVADPTKIATPSGKVKVVDTATGRTVASGSLSGGQATLTYSSKKPGAVALRAVYLGNASLDSTQSSITRVTMTKARAKVGLRLSATRGKHGRVVKATVKVPTVAGVRATGKVVLKAGGHRIGTARLKGGRATITWRPGKAGAYRLSASYRGDATYTSDSSKKVVYRVF
ncbi:S8 family serine peptidase [Nocardioides sp. URHA0020]|uniref:S8 family serine peptidase n=1 Tax=Nocardioides sp. URHA0020 TaxID=1380392 RepID=UPI00068882FB|nr:S8 family serine peptidase [Nocardioides sp. URHA0020]